MFTILAIVVANYSYFKLIGFPILLSRGSASAILGLLTVLLFLVSYDVLTCLRGKCCLKNCTIIDKKILFHRISGFMILGYSVLHTIGHLTGSMKTAATANLDDLNAALLHKRFQT